MCSWIFNEKNSDDFDIENWLWKSHFGTLIQNSKFNNFLLVCWFLGKNLSNFVSPIWKLHNPYCHTKEYTIASKILWQRRLKIIVVSTWKSGSTLLSDLFASMPNSFVIYEPLHHYGIHRLISTTDKIYNEVISLLISLLDCDFSIFKSE